MTKIELLDLIQATHADLLNLLGSLNEGQLTRAYVEGYWTVKDVVAHLAFWEQTVADELKLFASGAPPPPIPSERIQAINEENFQRNRLKPMAEIRADLDRSMRAMIDSVSALSEEALAGPCTWADGGPVGNNPAEEMEHWQNHMAAIQEWLAESEANR